MIRSGVCLRLLSAPALIGTASAQSDLVKRGDYLVNGILTCGNCHTPKGPTGGHRWTRRFPAGCLEFDEPPFKVTALQHHAGQGNRHRQLERRRHQDSAAHRRAAERHRRSP